MTYLASPRNCSQERRAENDMDTNRQSLPARTCIVLLIGILVLEDARVLHRQLILAELFCLRQQHGRE